MKKVHIFRGEKGGVGCTTVATGFACWLAQSSGEPVTLIGMANDDVTVVLYSGWKNMVTTMVSSQSLLSGKVEQAEGFVVVDAGTEPVNFPHEWHSHLVTDSHYLSLRRITQVTDLKDQYEDLVVVHSPQGALSVHDCLTVTRLPLFFSVERTPETARAVDAGLFPQFSKVEEYCPILVEA